ncbi:MAG: Glutathione-binding protein GsiB [Dehalococcoidia bacterium]|nr:Glutathione-binding protein GsiB [Bacillota bacterium]
MKNRILVLSLVMLLALSLVAIGCPAPVQVEPLPPEQRLIIGQVSDPTVLDSHHVADVYTATILEHIAETLLKLTPEGEVVPWLAEKWEVSPDTTEFTLTLRKGIKFHDGESLNAEAVKVNFDRRLDPKAGTALGFLVDPIKAVSVVDEYTVRIETYEPYAPMLSVLTHGTNAILSPAALRASWDKPMPKPVATGPFVFKEWLPGERVTLVRNEAYWGELPILEEIVFRIIPEDAARVMALEIGEIHVATLVPTVDVPRLKVDPEIYIEITPGFLIFYLGFNTLMEPFNNRLVRQALNYAVNKEAIVKHVLGGAARVADAPIAPAVFGYHPIMTYEYNPERAKALLAEAGFPDGFETTLYTVPIGLDWQVAAVADLFKVGVRVKIDIMDWPTFLELLALPPEEAVVPMFRLGWSTVTGDADYGLYPLFHSGQWAPVGWNRSFFKNERVDELLEIGRTTADPELRQNAYKEAMEIIMYEAPWLFLHNPAWVTGVRTEVKGLLGHPTRIIDARNAWIE